MSQFAACIQDLLPSYEQSMIFQLIERLFTTMGEVPSESYLIVATTKAGIDNLERIDQRQQPDLHYTLPSGMPAWICQKLGLAGEGINISGACASSAIAIAQGASMISSGRVDVVLICCMDLVTEFVFSGFSALKILSPVPSRPFDNDRLGLSLGEAAASLLLMSRERAQHYGKTPIGTICGWGIATDAAHITSPAKDGLGLIQAIHQALRKACIKEEEIAAINAHGTGTVYNDLMELIAFHNVFGNRKMPIHSVKGAIGHTMGAAGGVEAAISLNSLITRIVPPTVGFLNPEEGAEGLVSSEPFPLTGNYILTTNSGFSGINAAVVLGKGRET
jgi:3-oxoacyl-[acyl-carrier-protein] synthase II